MASAASPAAAAASPRGAALGGEGEGVLPGVLESAGSNGLVRPQEEPVTPVEAAVTAVGSAAPASERGTAEGAQEDQQGEAIEEADPPAVKWAREPHMADAERTKQFAFAIASLRMYNPEFRLTPEVIEIMRVFFEDLDPDGRGTVSLRALFEEIERLDPKKELVSEVTRQHMWHDIGERVANDERIDFDTFCSWVMRWKETSPAAVQNVYTSWAKELTVMDFGLNEGDGMFVVPSDEQLSRDEDLRFQLSALLRRRRNTRGLLRERPSRKPADAVSETLTVTSIDPTATAQPASEIPQISAPEGDEEEQVIDREHVERKDTQASVLSSKSIMTVSKSFVAGGLAGMVAKSALAPVDRIKLMFQVSDKRTFSFRGAFGLAKEIYVQDGFRALFRGNTLNIIRVVPYAGVQHSSFDFFRRQFHAYNARHAERAPPGEDRDTAKLSNVQLIAAGSLAGGLSLTISYPLDIVRARFMVQHGKHNFKSIHQAVMEMYRVDGARSFTRGLLPSLMGTLPYTGIGFTLNERFKHWMLELQQSRASSIEEAPERLHPFSKLLCSYLAACIAQTATYPMDTIRRRIQTDGFVTGNGKKLRYTGIATTARIILANEGWRGFFKGVTVNWMRSPLATGISLTAYDLLKEVLGVEQVAN